MGQVIWVVLTVGIGSVLVESLLFVSGLWLRGVGEDISVLAYMFLVVVAGWRVARNALHREVWARILAGVVGASVVIALFIHVLHNYLAPESLYVFLEHKRAQGEIIPPENENMLKMAWRNGLMALFNFVVYTVVGVITGWVSSAIVSGEKSVFEA